jgi:hypothetical protein
MHIAAAREKEILGKKQSGNYKSSFFGNFKNSTLKLKKSKIISRYRQC